MVITTVDMLLVSFPVPEFRLYSTGFISHFDVKKEACGFGGYINSSNRNLNSTLFSLISLFTVLSFHLHIPKMIDCF